MSEPLVFFAGMACGGLIFGSLAYVSGKKKGEEVFKRKVYDQHMGDYLEWTAQGGLRLKREVLETELQRADNDVYGVGKLFRQAISQTKDTLKDTGSKEEATKFFMQKAKLILELILSG